MFNWFDAAKIRISERNSKEKNQELYYFRLIVWKNE